jgi:hypothetical protein
MPHIAVDLERLKTPHCGLGQYTLHLGRALAHCADERTRLTYFAPADQAERFAGLDVTFEQPTLWRREAVARPLRPLLSLLAARQAPSICGTRPISRRSISRSTRACRCC